jgi:hypothetical protein
VTPAPPPDRAALPMPLPAPPPPDGGGKPHAEAVGTYAVVAGPGATVMLDTRSGKTWVLTPSFDDAPVWVPVKRIDSEDEAARWRAEMKEYAREKAQRRNGQ